MKRGNASSIEAAKMTEAKAHKWLMGCEYIGGDRCILNTQKLVQMVMALLKDMETPAGLPGLWGPSFDESNSPARRIRGDLDELLVSVIIPDILPTCKNVPLERLPDCSYLITVLDLFQRFLKGDPTKPLPVALTFGLHAMLTYIFVLQGDGSYNMLFDQLQTVSDRSKSPENHPLFYENVNVVGSLVGFAKPLPTSNDPRRPSELLKAEMRTFWNPVIEENICFMRRIYARSALALQLLMCLVS